MGRRHLLSTGEASQEWFGWSKLHRSGNCPAGEQLNYGGHNARNRTHVYIGTQRATMKRVREVICLWF
jgi:hypothetical protein